MSVVRYLAHRVGVMHQGKIVEEADTAELFANPQHDYTKRLLLLCPDSPPVTTIHCKGLKAHIRTSTRSTIRRASLDLITPLTTSFSTQTNRDFLIVEATSGTTTGYGECGAFAFPYYSEEYLRVRARFHRTSSSASRRSDVIGHRREIRASLLPSSETLWPVCLEGAIGDLWAKLEGVSLANAVGGTKSTVDVGLSVGIKESESELVDFVSAAVDEGFSRIKVKIKPGSDLSFLRAVRTEHPEVPLMADANSAYTLARTEHRRLLPPSPLHDDRTAARS